MSFIYIFPFCGTGKEVLDCLSRDVVCIGFITEDVNWVGKWYNDIPIFSVERLKEIGEDKMVLVHGSPNSFLNRKQIADKFSKYKKTTIIHPSAQISSRANIGNNVIIMANVVISSDVQIGDNVLILPNTTIHHDSVIGHYSILGGNVLVAGNVKIGENCYIGAGCNIRNGVSIAGKTMVGMGSNVIKSVNLENTTIKGNPAK